MSITRQSTMVVGQYVKSARTRWLKLLETARDPYRPERHYMRGPGPKWHAKHPALRDNGAL
jgi:hypothetical protein